MSYCRSREAGTYIWSDSEYMHFNDIEVSERDINIFLSKLYDYRKKELKERIELGRKIIKEFQKENTNEV